MKAYKMQRSQLRGFFSTMRTAGFHAVQGGAKDYYNLMTKRWYSARKFDPLEHALWVTTVGHYPIGQYRSAVEVQRSLLFCVNGEQAVIQALKDWEIGYTPVLVHDDHVSTHIVVPVPSQDLLDALTKLK